MAARDSHRGPFWSRLRVLVLAILFFSGVIDDAVAQRPAYLRYIVSFRSYRSEAAQFAVLDRLLNEPNTPQTCPYARVARSWPAVEADSPPPRDDRTDFVVIRWRRSSTSHAVARCCRRLARAGPVRGVGPDRQHVLDPMGSGGASWRWTGGGDPRPRPVDRTKAVARVAIFDTGVAWPAPCLQRLVLRTDWTDERLLGDALGHGTFVAHVLAGTSTKCPGAIPPDEPVELLSYRVFDTRLRCLTSWLLDALNHALTAGVDVINISLGGDAGLNQPLYDKLAEVAASSVIVVAAAGNHGPGFGTIRPPATFPFVIAIGAADLGLATTAVATNGRGAPAAYSSRGPAVLGEGPPKPDYTVDGSRVCACYAADGALCSRRSGTSFAAAAASGVVARLVRRIRDRGRIDLLNHAFVRLGLTRLTTRWPNQSVYAQGSGLLDARPSAAVLDTVLDAAMEQATRAALFAFPAAIAWDQVADSQTITYWYPEAMQPLIFPDPPRKTSVAIFHATCLRAQISRVSWGCDAGLHAAVAPPPVLWPHGGALGIELRATPETTIGPASGVLTIAIACDDHARTAIVDVLHIPVSTWIAPRADDARHHILWDVRHNLVHPWFPVPTDGAAMLDPRHAFDDRGDAVNTNYVGMWSRLRRMGLTVDMGDAADGQDHGTILVLDPEVAFSPDEADRLVTRMLGGNVALVVFADWYADGGLPLLDSADAEPIQTIVGGCHVPGLNRLLAPLGVAFSGRPFSCAVFDRGTTIARFPGSTAAGPSTLYFAGAAAIAGTATLAGGARVAVFGDSSCFEDPGEMRSCFELAVQLIRFATYGIPLDDDVPQMRLGCQEWLEASAAASPVQWPRSEDDRLRRMPARGIDTCDDPHISGLGDPNMAAIYRMEDFLGRWS